MRRIIDLPRNHRSFEINRKRLGRQPSLRDRAVTDLDRVVGVSGQEFGGNFVCPALICIDLSCIDLSCIDLPEHGRGANAVTAVTAFDPFLYGL
jgi:hypothetical protein